MSRKRRKKSGRRTGRGGKNPLSLFLSVLVILAVWVAFLYFFRPQQFETLKNQVIGYVTSALSEFESEIKSAGKKPVTAADLALDGQTPTEPENSAMFWGNPSAAVADVSARTNYLMVKPQFTMSYNDETLIPNWVMWHLSTRNFGETERGDDFRADEELPDDWYAVVKSDYQYSQYGFDRGHVCPSAARTSTAEDNSMTFLMTNMIPQSPDCNRVVWKDLEAYERDLAKQGKELYVAAGPYGKGGESNLGYFETISIPNRKDPNSAGKEIVVPSHCWKIVVIMEDGDDDYSRISTDTEVLAVFMPNKQGIGKTGSWNQFLTSVDYIEEKTGYDFLAYIPDEIENVLETKVYGK